MRIALEGVLPLLLAALALAGCARKEIGEICKDDDEFEFECRFPSLPGAERKLCAKPCTDDADYAKVGIGASGLPRSRGAPP